MRVGSHWNRADETRGLCYWSWFHKYLEYPTLCFLAQQQGTSATWDNSNDFAYLAISLDSLNYPDYCKHAASCTIAHIHIWYGHGLMALGTANGGLGLQLARNIDGSSMIGYSAIPGIFGSKICLVYCSRSKKMQQGFKPNDQPLYVPVNVRVDSSLDPLLSSRRRRIRRKRRWWLEL